MGDDLCHLPITWEQRRLGELLVFSNGFNGSRGDFGEGIALISVMDVLCDDFITYGSIRGQANLDKEAQEKYSVEYGDVLFQRSSENYEDAGTSNVYLDQHKPAAFGGFVIRGRKVSEYEPTFMMHALRSIPVRNQITCRAQGAQHINVSQDTLADVIVKMPPLPEQQIIGTFFSRLDSLITLHQRKRPLTISSPNPRLPATSLT